MNDPTQRVRLAVQGLSVLEAQSVLRLVLAELESEAPRAVARPLLTLPATTQGTPDTYPTLMLLSVPEVRTWAGARPPSPADDQPRDLGSTAEIIAQAVPRRRPARIWAAALGLGLLGLGVAAS